MAEMMAEVTGNKPILPPHSEVRAMVKELGRYAMAIEMLVAMISRLADGRRSVGAANDAALRRIDRPGAGQNSAARTAAIRLDNPEAASPA